MQPSRKKLKKSGQKVDTRRLCRACECRKCLKIKPGGVAERLKAPVLKTGSGLSRSWVRIPPPPPESLKLARYPQEPLKDAAQTRMIDD